MGVEKIYCAECGKTFTPNPRTGSRQRFCSSLCRSYAHRKANIDRYRVSAADRARKKYWADPDVARAYNKSLRKKNHDQIKASERRRYAANLEAEREKVRVNREKRRAADPEKFLEHNRERRRAWNVAHPENVRAWKRREYVAKTAENPHWGRDKYRDKKRKQLKQNEVTS